MQSALYFIEIQTCSTTILFFTIREVNLLYIPKHKWPFTNTFTFYKTHKLTQYAVQIQLGTYVAICKILISLFPKC